MREILAPGSPADGYMFNLMLEAQRPRSIENVDAVIHAVRSFVG